MMFHNNIMVKRPYNYFNLDIYISQHNRKTDTFKCGYYRFIVTTTFITIVSRAASMDAAELNVGHNI